jgi:hypothetical protein
MININYECLLQYIIVISIFLKPVTMITITNREMVAVLVEWGYSPLYLCHFEVYIYCQVMFVGVAVLVPNLL